MSMTDGFLASAGDVYVVKRERDLNEFPAQHAIPEPWKRGQCIAALTRPPFGRYAATLAERLREVSATAGTASTTTTREDLRNGGADSLGSGFGVPVAHVRIAKSHSQLGVAEQSRDHRQRYARHHRMAGKGVTKVMEANVREVGRTAGLPP